MHRFQNSDLPVEERVDALLSELTDEEKRSMLLYRNPAVERLGIPEFSWWNEALHGLARSGTATVFPQAIALAATFTPEYIESMGRVIATEARARYFTSRAHGDGRTYKGLTMFSPNINIFRDPRWGRGHETYGEDPYLTARCGMAFVRGVQGTDPKKLDCAATPKHYAVHSGPEGCRLGFNVTVSERDLRETYLYAFRKCLTEGGAAMLMTAYNAFEGRPCSVNTRLIQEIARGEWKFKGVVVTDAGTADALHRHHHTVKDMPEALAAELRAGADVLTDLDPEGAMAEADRRGLIAPADVERALRNQLRLKFRLGMFDAEVRAPSPDTIECRAHRELALEIARRSIVLLSNPRGVLPLDPVKIRRVAVIGPNAAAANVLYGNYAGTATRHVTVLEGIIDLLGDQDRVLYALGSKLFSDEIEPCSTPGDGYSEAETAAERADAVIAVLGLSPEYEGEAGDAFNSDAAGDKLSLELQPCQLELLRRVRAAGKPTVLVNISGSALAVPPDLADAVVQVFYPGAEGGRAVAEVLFGRVNPSGRLPVTFYRSTGDLPPFADYSMENRTYRFFKGEPLYPFGFGLSYTTFAERLCGVPESIGPDDDLRFEVEVENTGDRAGETVVCAYFSRPESPVRTPLKQLGAMARVRLEPGEKRRVELTVAAGDLGVVREDGRCAPLAGRLRLTVGNAAADLQVR